MNEKFPHAEDCDSWRDVDFVRVETGRPCDCHVAAIVNLQQCFQALSNEYDRQKANFEERIALATAAIAERDREIQWLTQDLEAVKIATSGMADRIELERKLRAENERLRLALQHINAISAAAIKDGQ